MKRAIMLTTTLAAALSLAACAESSLLTTSLGSQPATTAALPAAKPKVDPACAALAARISEIRKDGLVERVEAASKGKSATVNVKRASLGQMAELEKLNADFQAKCSTLPQNAAATPAATPSAAQVAAAAAAAKPVATAAAKAAATSKPAAQAAATAAATAAVTQAKQ